jgi:hypothetical protein
MVVCRATANSKEELKLYLAFREEIAPAKILNPKKVYVIT